MTERVCHTNLLYGPQPIRLGALDSVLYRHDVSPKKIQSLTTKSFTSIHSVVVTKLQDIGALEFSFITKGAENGIGLVEEVQDGIKFCHPSVIHDDNTVIMRLRDE